MYKVIKSFTDLKDGNHAYAIGDRFPRAGVIVEATRIDELAGSANRQGVPLIEEVVEKTEENPKKKGSKK